MRHNFIIDGSVRWQGKTERDAVSTFNLPGRREEIYMWVREIRGGIIAGASDIERHLDLFLAVFFLGSKPDRRRIELFSKSFLENLSLERKVRASLQVVEELSEPMSKDLKRDLTEVRELRNALAHRPFWFEIATDDDDQIVGLVPFISRGKITLPLTAEFIEQTNDLVSRSILACSRLVDLCDETSRNA